MERSFDDAAMLLGGSSCMVKKYGKGRKMTGFQRHKKIVVLMDISKPSQTSMAKEEGPYQDRPLLYPFHHFLSLLWSSFSPGSA